jgi:hypothetical protein
LAASGAVLAQIVNVQHEAFLVRQLHTKGILVLVPRMVIPVIEQFARSVWGKAEVL